MIVVGATSAWKNWGKKYLGKSASLPRASVCFTHVHSSQARHLALFLLCLQQSSSLSVTCIVSHGSANCRLRSPLDVKVKSAHEAALVVFKLGFLPLTVDHVRCSSSPDHLLVPVSPC